jgi:hypothetical protein
MNFLLRDTQRVPGPQTPALRCRAIATPFSILEQADRVAKALTCGLPEPACPNSSPVCPCCNGPACCTIRLLCCTIRLPCCTIRLPCCTIRLLCLHNPAALPAQSGCPAAQSGCPAAQSGCPAAQSGCSAAQSGGRHGRSGVCRRPATVRTGPSPYEPGRIGLRYGRNRSEAVRFVSGVPRHRSNAMQCDLAARHGGRAGERASPVGCRQSRCPAGPRGHPARRGQLPRL